MLRLVRPDSPRLWAIARQLVEAYAASLDVDLGFQDFGREIESLATDYGPPGGCFLLAEHGSRFVGCGAFHTFAPSRCEMKRLYVMPEMHGRGIGRALAQALIEDARHRGYHTMLLDTLPSMKAAVALYVSLGFRATAAYRYNPVPGAIFLERPLRSSSRRTASGEA